MNRYIVEERDRRSLGYATHPYMVVDTRRSHIKSYEKTYDDAVNHAEKLNARERKA